MGSLHASGNQTADGHEKLLSPVAGLLPPVATVCYATGMSTVSFEVGDDLLVALKATPVEAAAAVRLAAAAKLYELGRLSSGAAARLAGVPRVAFLQRLAEYGVAALSGTAEELEKDLENA
jgi:predicted HTH domain antitoxin